MNAKFFVYENGGFIKIKMKPNQQLNWYQSYSTDEGYSYNAMTLYFDGVLVEMETNSGGRDCDGRIDYNTEYMCHVDHLKSTAYGDEARTPCPDWKKKRDTRVYDEYAQKAGY